MSQTEAIQKKNSVGGSIRLIIGLVVILLLSIVAWWLSKQVYALELPFGIPGKVLEFPLWAALVGLVGNVLLKWVGVYETVQPGVKTEMYLKIGLILLGAKINLSLLVTAAGGAIIQGILVFAIGGFLGLEIAGSAGLVFLVLFVMSVCYIGLGMAFGSLLSVGPLSGAYTAVLLLTIFGGAWMDLEEIGGVFQRFGDALPFAHALDATRNVMADGAGFGAIATDFYWVLSYAVVVAALAVGVFRRRMLE